MLVIDSQPKLTELHRLIGDVSFPINIKTLVRTARLKRYNDEVIDFYKAFPPDQVFFDRDELEARTEQIEILHTQTSAYEDEVRGAED
jgi:hypothetical protein